MRNVIKLTFTVAVISIIAGFALSFTYNITHKLIAEAEKRDFMRGLTDVLPHYDNNIVDDTLERETKTIYIAKNEGKLVGYAMVLSTKKGYGGEMLILLGVSANGEISGVEVLKHTETPGLGDKISSNEFLDIFKGLTNTSKIAVKKDGGIIDQFSGATISPRAVADAVADGLNFINKNVIEGAEL